MNKPPAFQLYARDWVVDTAYMSLEEQGAYLRLLCHQWIEGPLPNDRNQLAQRLGLATRRLSKFDQLWSKIGSHFPTMSGNGNGTNHGKVANPRLELVRAERAAFTAHQAAAGKRGAEKRWGTEVATPMATPVESSKPEDSSASASASASASGRSSIQQDNLLVSSTPREKKTKRTRKTRVSVKNGYTPEFEAVWAIYPKREGPNPKKAAFRQWVERVNAGYSPEEMYAGVKRYKLYLRTRKRGHGEGSSFVKQAATFFGRDLHFLEKMTNARTAIMDLDELSTRGPGGEGFSKSSEDLFMREA